MTVLERLYNVIVRVYQRMNKPSPPPLESISPESSLKADLGLDSLAFVLIMLETESEFGIALPADNMAACTTVSDVVGIIEKELDA